MTKSTVYKSAPANHTVKAAEPTHDYYFRNRKAHGQSAACFMGDSPKAGSGQSMDDTVTTFRARDGEVVNLTESDAEHLRSKGIEKPIVEDGPGGEKRFTGRYYIDRRFDLDKV